MLDITSKIRQVKKFDGTYKKYKYVLNGGRVAFWF